MTISLSDFWKRLESSGICSAKDCKTLQVSLDKKNSGAPLSDPVLVANYLIKKGLLTKFQAKQLLGKGGRALKVGDYLLVSDEVDTPFENWTSAKKISTNDLGLLIEMREDSISPLLFDAVGSSNRERDSIQSFEITKDGESCYLFSVLPPGKTLSKKRMTKSAIDHKTVCRLGIAVSKALDAIHSLSSVHRCLTLDHLWIGKDGKVTLLLEPSLDLQQAELKVSNDSTRFVAPEAVLGGQSLSSQTDIFSLGCVLFRLATGRDPYSDSEPQGQSWIIPRELSEAIDAGVSGEPLFRVLAFALAQKPQARFQTVQEFENALHAAEVLLTPSDAASAEGSRGNLTENKPEPEIKEKRRTSRKKPPSEKKVAPVVEQSGVQQGKKDSRTNSEKKTIAATQNVEKKSSLKPGDEQGVSAGMKLPEVKDSRTRARSEQSDIKNPVVPEEDTRMAQQGPPEMQPTSREPGINANAKEEEECLQRDANGDGNAEDSTGKSAIGHPSTEDSGEIVANKTLGFKEFNVEVTDNIAPVVIEVDRPIQKVSLADRPIHQVSAEITVDDPDGEFESSMNRRQSRRRKKKTKAPLILGGMCVAVLILLIGLIVRTRSEDTTEPEPRKRRPLPTVVPSVTGVKQDTDQTEETTESTVVAGYQIIEDDSLLFAPPYGTDSPTVPLSLLPPGPSVILSLRLSEFLKHPLADDLISGVSTGAEGMLEQAVERLKADATNVKRLTISLYSGEAGWPEVSIAVELNEPVDSTELIELLGVEEARTRENQKIFVGDQDGSDAYYWNVDQESGLVSAYAVGTVPRISEVASLEGGEIPLPRTSQALWSSTSVDSDFIVLFTPNFLFADGRAMLTTAMPELVGPLKRFTQPDINAGLITIKLNGDESVFIESRFAPSGGISEAALMNKVNTTVSSWPNWANEFILESVPDSSWRLLASRMPQMMEYLLARVRFGLSDNAVVANAYLPQNAFPQVFFAGLLAMNTPSSGDASSTTVAPVEMLSVEQMLDLEMTVSFDQESLEFALEAISNAFQEGLPDGNQMPKARIVGGDLELMGITQNQQVRDFSKSEQSLRAVLTDLVVQANPDKSATGPSDIKQSLIWVIAESDSGESEILITTRQAAERESYKLPEEFEIDAS
ncbi:protein kinase [bacterium]|nr:protein kinase [bacterium]